MNTLWYKNPATDWNSAFPVGNGRLGAMIYGNTGHEVIQLNEESVWSGPYKNRNNTQSLSQLKHIRSLVQTGKIESAQELAYEAMTGTPSVGSVYQSAGQLDIDFYTEETWGLAGPASIRKNSFEHSSCYRRELDLETAIATTSFSVESSVPSTADFAEHSTGSSITYSREVFASAYSNILVIHISASLPKSIYFRANLNRGVWVSKNYAVCDDTIALQDTHGIPFCAMATAVASGGTVCTRGSSLIVEGADEATIFVDIETAFRNKHYAHKGGKVFNPDYFAQWCADYALKNICFATGAPYAEIKANHIAEYSYLYNKNSFSLLSEEQEDEFKKCSVDELLQQKESSAFAELYWNYNRYLLISSSRQPGKLPAAVCGLWTKEITGADKAYTLGGGMEMNYWAANMCSLSKSELPLFTILAHAYKHGRKTARTMYGCDGYAAHRELDIWGDTAPFGEQLSSTYWVLGAALLAIQIREHFEYTMDRSFLRKNYYLMKEACRFFSEYLVLFGDGKSFVVFPSVSPEKEYVLDNGRNGFFTTGCEIDNRILEQVFTATIQSAKDLGYHEDSADLIKFRAVRQNLIPPTIDKDNTLQEWNEEHVAVDSGNVCLNALYGLFPGHTITLTRTPALAEAAKNTIEKNCRGNKVLDSKTRALLINLYASLHKKEEAYAQFIALLKNSLGNSLVCTEKSLQVANNLGAFAGMTRMIVQSELVDGVVEINLLPALPDEWASGKIYGIKLKGNIKLDLEWKNKQLTKALLSTKAGEAYLEDIVVCYHGKRYESRLVDGALDILNVLPTTV